MLIKKILVIGTEDSLFDSLLNLIDVNLINILYSSDAEMAMYLIALFIPDSIFCSASIDKISYNMIFNFLRSDPAIANVPIVQFTDIDINQLLL